MGSRASSPTASKFAGRAETWRSVKERRRVERSESCIGVVSGRVVGCSREEIGCVNFLKLGHVRVD
jgi:hypothetical protein